MKITVQKSDLDYNGNRKYKGRDENYMAGKELIEEIGKYINKYYEPGNDDIKMDEEMKSIFDKGL